MTPYSMYLYHFEGVVDFSVFDCFCKEKILKTCWICGTSTGGLNTDGGDPLILTLESTGNNETSMLLYILYYI